MNLIYDDDTARPGGLWLEKVLQLYQITNLNHGLMMVGPTGSGKSCAWKVLLKALHRIEGVEGVAHVIDPKSITKDELYGYLDPNTREWKDGLFTHFLRKVIDNVRGELSKRQWIIFDGDVDPEWVENLNSVLDDNKLLTLPNGERLALPPNIRILFEVQDLKYATLATVSRCGMIWFSEDVVTNTMLFNMYLNKLKNVSLDESEQVSFNKTNDSSSLSPTIKTQRFISSILEPFFSEDGLVGKALEFASHQEHIMDFLKARCLEAMFSMMNQMIRNVIQYNNTHSDFVLAQEQIKKYITKSLVISIIWSFSGDGKLKVRNDLGDYIRTIINMELPSSDPKASLIDYEVAITGEWHSWASKVPQIDVDTSKIAGSDIVIPTIDTIRHENLLYTWLAEHKPLLLCGPPG
jgi:dynein heavy chain 1